VLTSTRVQNELLIVYAQSCRPTVDASSVLHDSETDERREACVKLHWQHDERERERVRTSEAEGKLGTARMFHLLSTIPVELSRCR
jgi:hypothetical protein